MTTIAAPQLANVPSQLEYPRAPSPYPGMGPRLIPNKGWTFRVWAPFADQVSLVTNLPNCPAVPLAPDTNASPYWSVHFPSMSPDFQYRYRIHNPATGATVEKIDPYVRLATGTGPKDFGIVHNPGQTDWSSDHFTIPNWNELVIYELHIGTFNDVDPNLPGNFQDVIDKLDHLQFLGINAIELLPANEFMNEYSMGYNLSLLFAVEEAYNRQKVIQELVKEAHVRGIAVIMDVVYNHFGPTDLDCCLWRFDDWSQNNMGGIFLYNDWQAVTPYGDMNRPDFGRPEIHDFIRNNVFMWLQDYHCDGLRWDSTINIRKVYDKNAQRNTTDIPAGWERMRLINDEMSVRFPQRLLIAEDLQGDEALTRRAAEWGAGFGSQWDSDFAYQLSSVVCPAQDADRDLSGLCQALQRKYNSDACRRVIYSESHDEAKSGRLPDKIWWGHADSWAARKRSTLAAAVTLTAPGIPMLFMGQEFLQWGSWNDRTPLDWTLRNRFDGIFKLYQRLIRLRRNQDFNTRGLIAQEISLFHVNHDAKVLAFHRWMYGGPGDDVIVVANFSAQPFFSYNLGFPRPGTWYLRFNSDWSEYAGDFSNIGYDTTAFEGINPAMRGMNYNGNVGLGPYSLIVLSQ
jgi:1,4-alpha-glucan branching enzyme